MVSATSTPSRTCAAVTTMSAAVSGASRPTGAAPISSLRPLSSSAARVAADEEHAHQRDERRAEAAELEGDVAADGRERRRAGPTIAIRPGLPGRRWPRSLRAPAAVGNRLSLCAAVHDDERT